MLFEYAVEPRAIGSSWHNFRYLIEKFGFDRGRLISRFPGKWERAVIEAAQKAGMGDVQFKSLVSRLQIAKRDALIPSGREYDPFAGDWLDNALKQQEIEPFYAIIASENRGERNFILVADDVDEGDPLMRAPHNIEVVRVGAILAEVMAPLLKAAKDIRFVDRFFNIEDPRYKETLKAALTVVAENARDGVRVEIHYCEHDRRPPAHLVEKNAGRWLAGVIPAGISINLFAWKEKPGGADFHARYLLTDRGGIKFDAGFSAEGAHQKVDLDLLDLTLCRSKLEAFNRGSKEYDLVEPAFEVSSEGKVRRI